MKKLLLIILFSVFTLNIFASHIVGGEVAYTYLGPGSQPNTSRYSLLLRLFTECGQICGGTTGVACPPTAPIIGIFNNLSPYSRVTNVVLSLTGNPQINLSTYPPCLSNQPVVCYQVNTYSAEVELTNTPAGYRFAYQSCCRAASINVSSNAPTTSNVPGATYEAVLPGTSILTTGTNSTAIVSLKDTALVCHNSFFTLEFSAIDPDNDSLSYEFTPAYNGGSFTASNEGTGPDVPLYGFVNYEPGYSGTLPFGSSVNINPYTGIISGIAPNDIGDYVINVIVKEWRSGILIAQHQKDFLVRTEDCTLTKATLSIIPATCDGFTVDFSRFNISTGNITSYQWIFGDPASGSLDTSTLPGPTHIFTNAGIYNIRLKVASGTTCIDSISQPISVFPGFFPDFTVAGQCKNTPIQFQDISTTLYGVIDSWKWNFGDPASASNTSTLQNPTHIYAGATSYNVNFIVTSSKGCIDTVPKTIVITDKPALSVTPDTLICIIDTLQLNAVGTGSFLWSPNYNISSLTIPSPLVSPDVTTTYRVTLTDPFGCTGTDSVKVSVVTAVTQSITPADTTICTTDSVLLKLNSNALYYQWTENPAGNTLSNPAIKNPVATPVTNTTYAVTGSIGKCIAQNSITINVVPYPNASAGADQTVCFGFSAQLNASGGRDYTWSPATFLSNPLIANPVSVNPTANVRYIVAVTDVLGCPKPSRDTVFVAVSKIKANAGPADTSVVLGQPLQLNATGGNIFLWDPPRWLNNIAIGNPISLPQEDITYKVRVSNNFGCFDYDTIRVHVYKLDPSFYVPTAFSPNGDGINDFFRPKAIGMKSLDVFRIYNRWGQLLYSSTEIEGRGWDGTFKGKGQDPATYVWYAEGTDYLNNRVKKKGYVVLIRQ
jgi:gliding motility-associated-like protein